MERPNNPRMPGQMFPRPTITNKYINRTHIPDKKVNEQLYNELLYSVETGNITRAKTLIQENPTLLNYKNELLDGTGNTPLHILLASTNLSKEDKLTLTKYMLLRGASPSSPNKYNITPLHLAVKNQLTDIVKLLLEYKADPNQLDSNNMNALHYAVLGKKMDKCPDYKEKKDLKKDINAPGIKELADISNQLSEFLFKWDNTEYLLENLFQYINLGDEIYNEEIKKIQESFNDKVKKIKLDTSKSDITKESEITKLTNDRIEQVGNVMLKGIKNDLEKNLQNNLEFEKDDDGKIKKIEDINMPNFINKIELSSFVNRNIVPLIKGIPNLDIKIKDDLDLLKKYTEGIYWFNKGLQVNYYYVNAQTTDADRRIKFWLYTNGARGAPLLPPGDENRYLTFVREDKLQLLYCVNDDNELIKNYDFNLNKDDANNIFNLNLKNDYNINLDNPNKSNNYKYEYRGNKYDLLYHPTLTNFTNSQFFYYNLMDGFKSEALGGGRVLQMFTDAEIQNFGDLNDSLKRTYIKPIYLMIDKINEYIDVYNENLKSMYKYLVNGELWTIYSSILPINIISFLNINNLRNKIREYIIQKTTDLNTLKGIFEANLKKIRSLPALNNDFKHSHYYEHINKLIVDSISILDKLFNNYFDDNKSIHTKLIESSISIKKMTEKFNIINELNFLKKYHKDFSATDFFEPYFDNSDLSIDITNFSEYDFDTIAGFFEPLFNKFTLKYFELRDFIDNTKYPTFKYLEPNPGNLIDVNPDNFKYDGPQFSNANINIEIKIIKKNDLYTKDNADTFISSDILNNHFITIQSSIAKEISNIIIDDNFAGFDLGDNEQKIKDIITAINQYTKKYLSDYTIDENEYKLKLLYGLLHEMIENYVKTNIKKKAEQIIYKSDELERIHDIKPLRFENTVTLMKLGLDKIEITLKESNILENDIFLKEKEEDKKINYNKKDDSTCYKIDLDIVERLLNSRVNLNQKDNNNKIPVVYAIENKNLELIYKLIPKKSEPTFYKNNKEIKKYFNNLLTNTIEEIVINKSYETFYEKYKNKIIKTLSSKSEINTNILSSVEYTVPFYVLLLNNLFYYYIQENINTKSCQKEIFAAGAVEKTSIDLNVFDIKLFPLVDILKEHNTVGIRDDILDRISKQTKTEILSSNKYKILFTKIENSIASNDVKELSKVLKYYKTLIKKYVSEKNHFENNIHLNLLNNLINKENTQKIIEIFNKFELFSRNYKECPNEYNDSNFILKETINIIIHVLEHSVLNYLYNAIVKLLIKEIENSNPDISKDDIIDKIELILDDKLVLGGSIYNYIMKEMGEKLVKKTLNIYDGEADPDMYIDYDTIFGKLKSIINKKIAGIIDSKNINTNYDSFIYPYFREYSKIIIKELYELTNNFMDHLIGMNKMLEIYSTLN